MEIKIGPISSHSFEGILLVGLLWMGVIWLLVQYTAVPIIVILIGTLGVASWILWIIFQLLNMFEQIITSSSNQKRSTENTPPTICPRCQAKNSYEPRFTSGSGSRVSHYVCENCDENSNDYNTFID